MSLSGSPSISGDTVTLTLASAVLETDTDVKVSYARSRDGHGQQAAGRGRQQRKGLHRPGGGLGHLRADPSRAPRSKATTLTLAFDEALDTTAAPAASAFTVSGTDSATSVTGVAFKSGDATKVELTLSPAVGRGEGGITVAYDPPGRQPAPGRSRTTRWLDFMPASRCR